MNLRVRVFGCRIQVRPWVERHSLLYCQRALQFILLHSTNNIHKTPTSISIASLNAHDWRQCHSWLSGISHGPTPSHNWLTREATKAFQEAFGQRPAHALLACASIRTSRSSPSISSTYFCLPVDTQRFCPFTLVLAVLARGSLRHRSRL